VEELTVIDAGEPRPRPFTLGDAMIFIIGLALGLAVARPAISLIVDAVRSDHGWRVGTLARVVSLGRMCNIVLLNFLVFLLPSILIARLRRPLPPLRAIACQPGFMVCALPLAVVVGALPLSLFAFSGLTAYVIETAGLVLVVGAAPVSWVVLKLTHRWRPEPGWIDRTGRVLGVLWMVVMPAHLLLIRLPY
jgi:hypothetical protein